ncbi:acyltransferase [Sphingomonas sp. CFBP 13728]|uniref:acyltransferase family protein n=1 Tax=Sphingomonas sp. CFBP 13728 TaxID=2775294 RepID=UPI00177BF57A|nr:acyltransferase [Sphingomonas sp. CFBP 13728]MBD8620608.1 acyltransferase [Sphingomonas sp. CFBP 13728]
MTLESAAGATTIATMPTCITGRRLNNIAELRLLFAASVVLSHAATLLGDEGYRLLRTVLNSEAAVQGFFILSGYLVCGSYARIQHPAAFYRRRFLRIYPAYAAAVVILTAASLLQSRMQDVSVAWSELPRYFVANLLTLNFFKPTIDGMFADNAFQAVNGALWSIKVEIMFYAILPVVYALARRWTFLTVSMALVVAGVLWWPLLRVVGDWFGYTPPLSLKFQLPGQIHFFGLGIALFANADGSITRGGLTLVCAVGIGLLMLVAQTEDAVHVLALVTLVGGISRLPQVRDMFGKQDISFGIYLCHFPIIQMLLAGGAAKWPFALYLATVCVLAIGYGLLSWNLIERPVLAIRRKPRRENL